MQTATISRPETRHAARRLGYGIAVIVNVVMLVVAVNILDWGWLGFLTSDYADLVPWISLSLIASIVVNLVYQFEDSPVVRSSGQLSVNLISLFVMYQALHVFPFDFTAYEFNWSIVARIVLILAMVGAGIGMLTEAYRLASHEPDKERR